MSQPPVMLHRDAIAALVPHAGAMCLWDEVVGWDDGSIHLRARNHRDAAHPLRSHGRLRAVHLCEYGAQAMAVHGGLLAQRDGGRAPPGMLVALRDIALHVARIDTLPGPIECTAEVLMRSDGAQQYAFRILHGATLLAAGRATVMLQA
jgi:predicted hotdog family 3-hydroxylacyl-ACP dehydratase